jgi:hypothetical protein
MSPGPWHDQADHLPGAQQINFFALRSFLVATTLVTPYVDPIVIELASRKPSRTEDLA